MTSYAVAADLLALLSARGEKPVPTTALSGGRGLSDGSGMSAGIATAETTSVQLANQPVARTGFRLWMALVPGPPPRGVPV